MPNEEKVEREFYKVGEVATILNVSQDKVRAWIKDGRLSCIKDNQILRIPRSDVESFVKELSIAKEN